jgi:hypothetical protein
MHQCTAPTCPTVHPQLVDCFTGAWPEYESRTASPQSFLPFRRQLAKVPPPPTPHCALAVLWWPATCEDPEPAR